MQLNMVKLGRGHQGGPPSCFIGVGLVMGRTRYILGALRPTNRAPSYTSLSCRHTLPAYIELGIRLHCTDQSHRIAPRDISPPSVIPNHRKCPGNL